jgi:hypothetical protein
VISSAQFSTQCAAYYAAVMAVAWDLDLDGAIETPGTSVTLSAASLDNRPLPYELKVEARHPADGLTTTKKIAVTVLNVQLLAARAALRGAGQSGDPSGALARIDKDLVAAAIARLNNASRHLSASGLADAAAIVAVLQEIVASLQS